MKPDDQLNPTDRKPVKTSDLSFPVVGLGASAGGIEALGRFFEQMPGDSGMAFVVILHLSPKHESNVDKILQRVTKMPVLQVQETMPIEKNRVYVISPAMQLAMSDGHLHVSKAQRPREKQVAIDLFFRTLAEAHSTRAFAIVLSGTGADGSLGLARVKELGGLTFAQSIDDAGFDGMPRSAIEGGMADFVLPVVEMPQKLLDLWDNARHIELPSDEPVPPPAHQSPPHERATEEEQLLSLLRLLSERTGHDFRHYKRATVLRRIERRLQVSGLPDIPRYLAYVEKNNVETEALLGDLLIGVTNFFRDRAAFEALERDIIPEIVQKGSQSDEGIRVWTAACSTGEEAYSLAMMLSAEATVQNVAPKLQVFASDVDERAITIARRGVYPPSIVIDVPPAHLREYFTSEAGHYRISKPIRDRVLFALHNVLSDPPFSRLQLITCRNFLIYLDRHAQREALQIFHSALCPGGYLFLGTSESTDATEGLFTTVDKKNRIYRAVNTPGRSTRLPTVFRGDASRPIMRQTGPLDAGSDKALSHAEEHQQALERYGPPTILIDQQFQILHISGNAGQFLRYVDGGPSRNLLALVDPKLRTSLRTGVLKAKQTSSGVDTDPVALGTAAGEAMVTVTIRPFQDDQRSQQLVLLIFSEVESSDLFAVADPSGDPDESAVETLEAEIESLTAQLRETVSHADASTEDLRASNEELQAINEELRSATEELETSKEELQSFNEELVTVNTELNHKVEETAKINDDLQNLIASSDIATIVVDRAMHVKWFTPKTAALFNLIPADNGRPLTDITHRLDYPEMSADAADAFDSLRPAEKEVRASNGRWYLAKILPYRTADDRISGAILNFVDITARRMAERRVREGLERLRLVTESTTEFAIIIMDEGGCVTGWNRAAELMFGYSVSEIEGQNFELIFTPEDRADGVPAAELQRARDSGQSEDDRWHLRKDGSRLFCSGAVHPIMDGDLRGYAKIVRDMTAKRMEEDEQQSNLEQTQASNILKDEFIAIMSHELRHPLNLIQLNADLLARSPDLGSSANARAVETIQRSVHSQSQIIADLLDFSRAKTGKLRLTYSPVKIKSTLASIVEVVSTQAKAGDITLTSSGIESDGSDECIVEGDSIRIEQIVWNLLNNAIKFTPPGGTVTVSLVCEDGYACLEVRDTGIGISPGSLETIFDMFSQLGRHSSRQAQAGLGIGLALVEQLVAAHGGRVAVTSEGEGKGATFRVWLPLANARTEPKKTETPPRKGSLSGIRMLLVDDSKDNVELLGQLCEMEGAQVTTAEDGVQALSVLSQADFDILVSDIAMPNMDGYELLTALRKSDRNADIPAIALTGYGDTEKARVAGFNEQLQKPTPIEDLVNTLRIHRKPR